VKLHLRFSLFTSAFAIILIATTTGILYYTERKLLTQEIENKEIATIRQLAQIAREATLAKDDLLVLNYLNLLRRSNPAIVEGFYLDTKFTYLSHTDSSLISRPLKDNKLIPLLRQATASPNRIFQSSEKDFLTIVQPVNIGKNIVGFVTLIFSAKEISRNIEETLANTRNRIYSIALLGILLGIFGSIILAHAFVQPVKQIATGAQEIGKGNLNFTITIARSDELGYLANEFNKMAKKLSELEEIKRDFIASVTHELRSPLAAIQSYVNLILTSPEKNLPYHEIMERIKNNTARLSRFINDLLDVAKIEAGKLDVNIQKCNLLSLVEDIFLLFKPLAQERNISLTMTNNLGSGVSVLADEDRLKQVITNLLSNALKFTPDGGNVRIDIEQTGPAHNPFARISVADSGIGIAPENLEKIFSKFEQVREARQQIKGPKGTGLGLTIAKAIVELHNGKIWVESTPGKGTTFFFTIPMVEEIARPAGIFVSANPSN